MIRELWDSIVNDPLLGYFKVVFVSEDGTETEGYMHEDYGVIIIKTVNQPSRGIDYRGGIYWTGTETLPANYMSSDSAMHLYQFVDNMPEFPYRDDDRSFDDAMNAFKPRVGLSKGRHTVVRFVVEADGTVSNAHIIKSSTPRENYFARVIATYPEIEALIEEFSSDYQKLTELQAESEEVSAQLEEKMEQWIELSE